ncbi:unnamed protein product [Rotaria sordida]|uniref:enoyl-CoA hydratase n=2 Tax=Rotaria sordida TaxID=392033 RepID=A0A819DU69_9BILA|nr:unnamed protein product [Rotaria sordida]CAF3836611.1 unnamed protein product [Rotaria sordida]
MTDLQQLKNIKLDYEDNIAIVQLNQENSKVNTLSRKMMNEFVPVFNHLKKDDNIKGIIVISAKPGSFIAGADINMFESVKSRDELYQMSRNGQEIMNQIEQSSKPIIAAIAGSCLGGGFEVALACHYRIGMNDKRTGFGVPEVKLGLLPGAGGTQRLLKNLSLSDALDLILTGKEIKAKKAKAMGLVDILVEPIRSDVQDMEEQNIEYLRSIAIRKVKEIVVQKPTKRKFGLMENIKSIIMLNSYVRNYILSQAQAKVMSQTQGLYPAPLKILDVIQQTLENGSKVGLNAEAEAFADLAITNESKALISLFHGRTECKKNKYGKPEREIKTIAIIGADEIGAGIAHVSIDKDFQVILYDTTSSALYHGQSQIIKSYQNYIKRNRITSTEYSRILSNLNCQTTFDNLEKCDIIIESVFEDLKLKQNILNELEQYIPEHCIFASNTYILSIHQIAANSRRPHKVIGMHYFSPVDKVELLEIIRAKQTSDNTICTAVSVGLKQGKIIIVVNDSPGFYTTRLLIFSFIEIFYLLQEGLLPNDIDKATKKFGFHIGLAILLDDFGIDMITYIVCHLKNIFGERLVNSSVIELLQIFVKNNLLGKKSGQGLYIYSNDGNKKINPKCKELLRNSLTQTKDISKIETIQWRISLRILNEAARCLEENVISSPTDGDIGAVFGFGFPPMKGGPFRFMDTYGTSNIVDLMNNYQLEYGDRFAPTQLLIDMAKENKKFYP